jgi:hypothetical protein
MHMIKRSELIEVFGLHYLSLFYSKFSILKADFKLNIASIDATPKVRGLRRLRLQVQADPGSAADQHQAREDVRKHGAASRPSVPAEAVCRHRLCER